MSSGRRHRRCSVVPLGPPTSPTSLRRRQPDTTKTAPPSRGRVRTSRGSRGWAWGHRVDGVHGGTLSERHLRRACRLLLHAEKRLRCMPFRPGPLVSGRSSVQSRHPAPQALGLQPSSCGGRSRRLVHHRARRRPPQRSVAELSQLGRGVQAYEAPPARPLTRAPPGGAHSDVASNSFVWRRTRTGRKVRTGTPS
jgi:hypothetical protein